MITFFTDWIFSFPLEFGVFGLVLGLAGLNFPFSATATVDRVLENTLVFENGKAG